MTSVVRQLPILHQPEAEIIAFPQRKILTPGECEPQRQHPQAVECFGVYAVGKVMGDTDAYFYFQPDKDHFSDTTASVARWVVPYLVQYEAVGQQTLAPTTDLLTTDFEA